MIFGKHPAVSFLVTIDGQGLARRTQMLVLATELIEVLISVKPIDNSDNVWIYKWLDSG